MKEFKEMSELEAAQFSARATNQILGKIKSINGIMLFFLVLTIISLVIGMIAIMGGKRVF
jgi:hypothetical protein